MEKPMAHVLVANSPKFRVFSLLSSMLFADGEVSSTTLRACGFPIKTRSELWLATSHRLARAYAANGVHIWSIWIQDLRGFERVGFREAYLLPRGM